MARAELAGMPLFASLRSGHPTRAGTLQNKKADIAVGLFYSTQ